MKFIDHQVPGEEATHHPTGTFRRRHAASSILEVQVENPDDTPGVPPDVIPDNMEAAGISGAGFYFWCEDEATAMGPYLDMQIAIENRNLYFESLNEPRLVLSDEANEASVRAGVAIGAIPHEEGERLLGHPLPPKQETFTLQEVLEVLQRQMHLSLPITGRDADVIRYHVASLRAQVAKQEELKAQVLLHRAP